MPHNVVGRAESAVLPLTDRVDAGGLCCAGAVGQDQHARAKRFCGHIGSDRSTRKVSPGFLGQRGQGRSIRNPRRCGHQEDAVQVVIGEVQGTVPAPRKPPTPARCQRPRDIRPCRGLDRTGIRSACPLHPVGRVNAKRTVTQVVTGAPPTAEIPGSPNGVRTRVSTLRGWCPRPLDDGTAPSSSDRPQDTSGHSPGSSLWSCRAVSRYPSDS